MYTDQYGQQVFSEQDLCEIFLKEPDKILKNVLVEQDIDFPDILDLQYIPKLSTYNKKTVSIEDYDTENQNHWMMPDEYKNLDIAKFILDLCKTDQELQRVGQELLMFQERNMFPLLQYLKYLVDTMRKNNVVWGVGRGSSVSSYVLFLLGVHRINSLYYDLSIDEFLK